MRKVLLAGLLVALLTAGFFIVKKLAFYSATSITAMAEGDEGEENERYENQEDRFAQLYEQMRDPALGYVPKERLALALEQTKQLRAAPAARAQSLSWQERGPIYDFVGSSNGNGRGGGTQYTAGIIQTSLIDTISDPTGNTILSGTPSGGLWKCTNLLSTTDAPNWQPVNDFMSNLAIASICRNPVSPNIMYIATGDGNSRDVRGSGVWKSTDNGVTWNLLPSSINFNYSFKIVCDAAGNVYLGTAGSGLLRSKDGGATWANISPSGIVATNPTYVPDIEISSNGRLHATFGYYGTTAKHYYTDAPAFAGGGIGWLTSTGITTATSCSRIEMASQGSVAYAITVNPNMNMDYCYKSTDDGATWTKMNTVEYPTGLGSGQGWYAITLAINPDDPNSFIVGGLDAYRSTNSGNTVNKITNWVSFSPYVHADHHWMGWYKRGTESRIMIGCDGGMFVSTDGGTSWRDRNQNLGIKQFYSCAIDPTAGSNVLLAGAQDNGVHLIKTAGKTFSTEVTGGDGAYVHINQANSQIMFGSYTHNVYRRSTNGGTSWGSQTLDMNTGYFINPYDYDDNLGVLYASDANTNTPNNRIWKWLDASTSGTASASTVVLNKLSNSNATAFKVSPYTANTVYIGGSTGKLLKLTNANAVTTATADASTTDISYFSFPNGYLRSINTGTDDQNLVITFSNYGVSNIWVSTNGGTNWTAVDGNLPDMPVWFATFEPGSNSRMIIGTETGVFTTDQLNGASTVWTPNPGFPMVRTTMLKVRPSDNTIVASTYGRGLWTATISNAVPIKLSAFDAQLKGNAALIKWTTSSEQNSANFDIEKSTDMVHFSKIGSVDAAGNSNDRRDYTFTDKALSENNYYRLRSNDKDGKNSLSQVVLVRYNASKQAIWVITNPFKDRIDVRLARQVTKGKLQLINLQGSVVAEKNMANVSGQFSWPLAGNLTAGTYILRTIVDGEVFTNKMIRN